MSSRHLTETRDGKKRRGEREGKRMSDDSSKMGDEVVGDIDEAAYSQELLREKPQYERESSRRLSSRKHSEKSERHSSSSRSRSRRHMGDRQSSHRRPRRRSSTETDDLPSNADRRISKKGHQSPRNSKRRIGRDSDHHHSHDLSRGKPASTKSLRAPYGDDEDTKAKMKSSKGTSERAITPGVEHIGSKRSIRTTNTLYGNDSDTKVKAMRASYERATSPGVEQIGSKSNRSINTLYGNDADDKAKAKASNLKPARTPGVQQVSSPRPSSKHSVISNTLYGSDADAKQKASARSSEFATSPGVDRVYSPSRHQKSKVSRRNLEQTSSPSTHRTTVGSSTAVNTLYGDNDADAKAKAKASRRSTGVASSPGIKTIVVSNSVHTATSTLYGSEADAKAKAKASGGSSRTFASSRGVISVGTTDSAVDTLYGNDADTKAKIRAARGGRAASFAAVPGAESLGNETTAEEPVARPVPIELGHTDSESESISEPERNTDAEVPSRRHRKSEKKGADDEQKKSRKKRCILLILFFLLLLIGAGVAVWYFLLRNDSGRQQSQIGNSNIQDPSKSPSSPTATSLSPTQPSAIGNSTMFPSAAPSKRFTYDPPDESDCQDIAANQTIAGRDLMENADFELSVEVVLFENRTLTEPLLQELLDAIQRKILPSLAGCSVIIDEFVEAWRFVIFDAFVTGSVPPGESCTDEVLMQLNCHHVSVNLDLFLKGKVRFIDIIALISAEGDNIANHLGLNDLFQIIKLIGAKSLVSTGAPTSIPSGSSKAPSTSPSSFPSAIPSKLEPTAMPVAGSTPSPTVDESVPSPSSAPISDPPDFPSTTPVAEPSNFPSTTPSNSPSNAPSSSPSGVPSGVPSVTPSESPTDMPTVAPAPGPTPFPSPEPSDTPSSEQSNIPTQAPTAVPTPVPTINPTQSPTRSPTETPSVEPSKSPTPRPSLLPTQTSINWEFVMNSAGTPATISSLDFRSLLDASPNRIVRRTCSLCLSSHQDIYYKRLTPLPAEEDYDGLAPFNFLDVFGENWFDTPSNQLNVDFELYSSYEDALSGQNRWQFCNYNDANVGFPSECGPSGYVGSQWYPLVNAEFWVESVNWEEAASSLGSGSWTISDSDFRILLANSPNAIVARQCYSCRASHQNIFYKRITPLPGTGDFDGLVPDSFLDLFVQNWFSSPSNLLNVDFELYSTYQDALAGTNRWTYCNYDDGSVGFPRDCGPTGYVPSQWNSMTRSQNVFRFWVEQ